MMKCFYKVVLLAGYSFLLHIGVKAQAIAAKIETAFNQFQNDPQLKYALVSLLVVDVATGKTVFGKNTSIGLTPASTQKVITSATAFATLGKGFQYQTRFARNQQNDLIILPSGDPTLGSMRWPGTRPEKVLGRIVTAIQQNLTNINTVIINDSGWQAPGLPPGWIWEDLGNYYGAAPSALNWRENQFDIFLRSGSRLGDAVTIVNTQPRLYNGYTVKSQLKAAAKGSGDNAYIFFPINGKEATIKGTVPVSENNFSISGAFPDPIAQLIGELTDSLSQNEQVIHSGSTNNNGYLQQNILSGNYTIFHTESSPPLDSIIYWFNRKSINLYGEALVQTMALQQKQWAATDSGLAVIKDFWKQQGVDPLELNIIDGSGLSPLNRVTTHAQVAVLLYARKQPWFSSFYASLPEYNGTKMKSGTIKNVKGFSGYCTAANGVTYAFSFVVNNYNGAHAALVRKMYTVLNTLK